MSRQPLVLVFLLTLAASPAIAGDDQGRADCAPRRSESFGHGYDPFDDGSEAWFAPNVGSWADHADAYYGYGERQIEGDTLFDQRGEVVDDR
ncbi:MAG: hypothetical protein U1E20_05140 [Methylocystis sp.]|uniref:hypothetical protein n=1 Tax=Methylocystis sp. TaxID=1911079 RepID=UPI003948B5CA